MSPSDERCADVAVAKTMTAVGAEEEGDLFAEQVAAVALASEETRRALEVKEGMLWLRRSGAGVLDHIRSLRFARNPLMVAMHHDDGYRKAATGTCFYDAQLQAASRSGARQEARHGGILRGISSSGLGAPDEGREALRRGSELVLLAFRLLEAVGTSDVPRVMRQLADELPPETLKLPDGWSRVAVEALTFRHEVTGTVCRFDLVPSTHRTGDLSYRSARTGRKCDTLQRALELEQKGLEAAAEATGGGAANARVAKGEVVEGIPRSSAASLPTRCTTAERLLMELQAIHRRDPDVARDWLTALAGSELGQELIRRLYFGGWSKSRLGGKAYDWERMDTLLDIRAFLTVAYGRVVLDGVYHLLFLLLVICIFLFEHPFTDFYPFFDGAMTAFILGGVVEEAEEFWTEPRYLDNFWNVLDCGAILALSLYMAWMDVEDASRFALAVALLLLLLRLLGVFRNAEKWPIRKAGMLIRTTIALLQSIAGFLAMYMYVIFAFSLCFFFLMQLDRESGAPGGEGGQDDDEGEAPGAGSAEGGTGAAVATALRRLRHTRVLKGHGGAGGGADAGEHANAFESVTSTFLWLFDASLGDFHFSDVFNSPYPVVGSGLLVVFLMVSAVILLNFMIAILSGTYEEHVADQRRIYLFDVGTDAMELTYEPGIRRVPWMPRPANLVNGVVLVAFHVLKTLVSLAAWLCRKGCGDAPRDGGGGGSGNGVPAGHRSWDVAALEFLDRTHFRAQLLVCWVFGNLLMVCLQVLLGLALLPITVAGLIAVSPFSTGCCLTNLVTGEIWESWQRFTWAAGAHTTPADPGSGSGGLRSKGRRLQDFVWSLRGTQRMMLVGPVIALLFLALSCVSADSLDEWLPWPLRGAFAMIENADLSWTSLPEGKLSVVRTVSSTCVLLVLLGSLLEVWELLGLLGGLASCCVGARKRLPLVRGWQALVAFAEDGLFDEEEEGEEEGERVDFPNGERSLDAADHNHDSPREIVATHRDSPPGSSRPRGSNKGYLPLSTVAVADVPTAQSATAGPIDSHGAAAASAAADAAAAAGKTPKGGPPPAILRVPLAGFLDFLCASGTSDAVRPLVVQAVQMIYKGEGVAARYHEELALCVDLEDWYLVTCSIVWYAKAGKAQLSLLPRDKLPPLEPGQIERLLKHPLLGLYCVDAGEVNPRVFFEDFFWGVWEGSFYQRHFRIEVLLRLLREYAVQQHIHEEEELVDQLEETTNLDRKSHIDLAY